MSKLKECVRNGEVKRVVSAFVDDYEDMFDCFVTDIAVSGIGDDGNRVEIVLRRGEE